MSMGSGGRGGSTFSPQLQGIARQLQEMERVATSGRLPQFLARSNQTAAQFGATFGNLSRQFHQAFQAETAHHNMLRQLDRVTTSNIRSTGGLAGMFGRLGGQVSGVTRLLGFGGVTTALTGAALQMERMSRATLNMANTARDLGESRGGLAQSIQGARRLGLTLGEAQKEVIDLTFTLQDLGQRGFGAMTEEMEKLGPWMFRMIRQLEELDRQGATGAQLREHYISQFEKLSDREQVYVARAMGHSTALRNVNAAMKDNIELLQASEQDAYNYNKAWVTVTGTLENLQIILGARAWTSFKSLVDAIQSGDPAKWKALFDLKVVDPEKFGGKLVTWLMDPNRKSVEIDLRISDASKEAIANWWNSTGIGRILGGQPLTDPSQAKPDVPLSDMGASPMSFQPGAARSGRGIRPGGRFGGLTVPEGWGGPNAIVLTETLRTEQEGNQTLREIRDILQRAFEIGGGAGGGGGDAAGAVAPMGGLPGLGGALRGGGGGVAPGGGVGSRETRADRNNNPGNIKFGPFAKSMGATGADAGGFAIFPDRETGFKAAEGLLGGKGYAGKTLGEIGQRWAAGDPNWAKNVSRATGIPTGAIPTAEQRSQIARTGIPTAEGSARTGAGDRGATGVPSAILAQAREVAKLGPDAVSQFMRDQGYPKSGAWCGQFAASVVRSSGGVPPKGYAVASNWRNWGTPVDQPQPGDIAVRLNRSLRRGGGYVPTGQTGSHVTTVGDIDPRTGTFRGIGGNQGRAGFDARYNIRGFEFRRGAAPTEMATPFRRPPEALQPLGGMDPAAQRSMIDGSGANNKWEGSAALDITVAGAAQVNTRRSMGFEPIRLTRTRQMPRPTAEGGTGAVDAYE